jgi:hypothetical protein
MAAEDSKEPLQDFENEVTIPKQLLEDDILHSIKELASQVSSLEFRLP